MIIIAHEEDFYNIFQLSPLMFSRIALREISPANLKRVDAISFSGVVPVLRARVS